MDNYIRKGEKRKRVMAVGNDIREQVRWYEDNECSCSLEKKRQGSPYAGPYLVEEVRGGQSQIERETEREIERDRQRERERGRERWVKWWVRENWNTEEE